MGESTASFLRILELAAVSRDWAEGNSSLSIGREFSAMQQSYSAADGQGKEGIASAKIASSHWQQESNTLPYKTEICT